MLHIHNGDSSANSLKESHIAGDHFAFRESLTTGPVPSGLSSEDWLRLRAKSLADDYPVDFQKCHDDLLQQQEVLSKLGSHEEVILWFEHDWYCQLHLVYLLQQIGAMNLGQTTLSLVCINEFPGRENFRGLGELTPDEMASLFDKRRVVTDAQKQLAEQVWQGYCATTPQALVSLLSEDTSALPFLKAALQKHVAQFPSTQNGLGLIENTALQLLREGPRNFSELFQVFGKAEPLFGLGDAQFWNILERLAKASEPVLVIDGEDRVGAMKGDMFRQAPIRITQFGEDVLSGARDFIRTNGIDYWLGGVHLCAGNVWRWDAAAQAMLPETG